MQRKAAATPPPTAAAAAVLATSNDSRKVNQRTNPFLHLTCRFCLRKFGRKYISGVWLVTSSTSTLTFTPRLGSHDRMAKHEPMRKVVTPHSAIRLVVSIV